MRQLGFSLVELSIVLVILGLLVGGILAGQSLIRASELRSVSADITKYQTAISAFRDKYFGLPGDITNATAFWGKDTTSIAACAGQTGTAATPGTCNGDGNGNLTNTGNEWVRAWQHLSNSGIIEGNYSGLSTGWTYASVPGVDVPAGKISNTAFSLLYTTQSGGNAEFGNMVLPDTSYNWIIFGSARNNAWPNNPALTVQESWNLDTKMDDGMPFRGRMHAGQRTICGTQATVPDSAYALDNTTGRCVIGYVIY